MFVLYFIKDVTVYYTGSFFNIVANNYIVFSFGQQ